MLCLRQVLSCGRTHFRHPLYCHVAPKLQCTSRTGMFRLTKCQTNLTRIVYPPLYSGEVTKNVGISSRRFYIPQPWARFSLTKRHPSTLPCGMPPHANDIRQPFPVTKSMRIWRTEIRQINQKSPSDLPFTPFTAPFFVMQKTVSGRQADNSIFFCSKTFSAFSQTKFQSQEIETPNSKEMRHKHIKRATYRFGFNISSLFEPFTTRCLCVKRLTYCQYFTSCLIRLIFPFPSFFFSQFCLRYQ